MKKYRIAFMSEKGGVGKTTVLTAMLQCLPKNKVCVANADMEGYSAKYVLQLFEIETDYRDFKFKDLMAVLKEDTISKPYILIDFSPMDLTTKETQDLAKHVDYFILPILPTAGAAASSTHLLKTFNILDIGRVYAILNLANNSTLEDGLTQEFIKEIKKFTNVILHPYPLNYAGNLDKNPGKLLSTKGNKMAIKKLIENILNNE